MRTTKFILGLAVAATFFCWSPAGDAQGHRKSNNAKGKPAGSGSAAAAATATAKPKPADVLAEINLVRTNPAKYAAYLEALKPAFKGNTLSRPGRPDLVTNEGIHAVDDAIRALKAAQPLPAYHLSPGMSRAAADQATDMVKNKISGHKGSDGSLPEDRCARYGRLLGSEAVGENIAYDGATAREVVMGFLIDDGVSNRGHRRNLLSSTYKVIGIGIGAPPAADQVYVLTFADGYTDGKGAPAKGKQKAARAM